MLKEIENNKEHTVACNITTFGHTFYLHEKDYDAERIYIFRDKKGKFTSIKNLECPRCSGIETEKGHDPCIANLPGVRSACCGHGVEEGYIMFEDGTTIRGKFEVERNGH